MRLTTAFYATALSAGLVLTGVQVAGASSGGVTLPDGGVLEQRVTQFCTRAPNLLERADQATTRLSGDASVRGSIAWLTAKQDRAEKSDHPRVAKRLDRVIERRTKRLATLPEVKQKLTAAQSECTTINQPAPTPSSS